MKRRTSALIPVLAGLAVAGWLWSVPAADAATARAEMKDARGEKVGEAMLRDTPDGVKLTVTFTGLPPGEHGFHVHAVGKCEPPFESAGGHFNPTNRQHGRDNPQGPHAGDLPNVRITDRKEATIEVTMRNVTLDEGPIRLLDGDGASIVVHAGPDDYKTDPAGNSGARIACGVIRSP